ncbi:MAG: hypothetical protein J6A00_02175 [Bacteroides sp.]|nr:hypothetical protein [Bacteroides sp.]
MKKLISIPILCTLLCGCQDESGNIDTSPMFHSQETLCEYLKIDKNANKYILTINEKEALEKGFSQETYHAFVKTVNNSNENIKKAIDEGKAISLVLSNKEAKDIQNVNLGYGIEYAPDTVNTANSRSNQSYYYISISDGSYDKWNAQFIAPEKIATQISVSGAKSGESIVIRCNNGKTAYGSTIQLYIYGSSITEVKYWWNTKSNNEVGGGDTGGGDTGGGDTGGGDTGGGDTTPSSQYILNIKPGDLDIKAGQEVYVGLDGTITPRAIKQYNWDFEMGGVAPSGYGGISFTDQ